MTYITLHLPLAMVRDPENHRTFARQCAPLVDPTDFAITRSCFHGQCRMVFGAPADVMGTWYSRHWIV